MIAAKITANSHHSQRRSFFLGFAASVAAAAPLSWPQLVQKRVSAGKVAPQFTQNWLISSPRADWFTLENRSRRSIPPLAVWRECRAVSVSPT
jgi:hypothetical protein